MKLHIRLAMVFGVLLFAVALALSGWVARIAERYQAEVAQRLNAGIAMYVTNELELLDQSGVNAAALKELAHRVMTVNPSAEVYLLDPSGKLVGTVVPADKLRRSHVKLDPINSFLSDSQRRPIYGDDPRDLTRQVVFSVAAVVSHGKQLGYLYVVLGGDHFASVADALRGSYSLKMGAIVLTGVLLVTLIIGASLFAILTLPLRLLARDMHTWSAQVEPIRADMPILESSRDEIAALAQQFAVMSVQIERHIEQIRARDEQRRELIAGISHDLRTPLASLHGYLETVLLKADQLSSATRRQYLETACRHSQQMQRLIAALFELSKFEAGAIVPNQEAFSLAELLQDIALRFRLRAQQLGITLVTQADPEACPVFGDVALVERIFENLLDNALRHTPERGSVTLAMNTLGDRMRICVSDSGRGVAVEDLPHIFDRYYRGHSQRPDGGAGLGLAIVRHIVELHGQTISVHSEPGAGTLVEFSLPLAAAKHEPKTHPIVAA